MTRHRDYQKPFLTALLVLLLQLGGCALPEPATGTAEVESWEPPAGSIAWQVNEEHSELELRVYRAGPLASFGHNHVIEFPVRGRLFRGDGLSTSGFRLQVPVAAAMIDRPAARAAAGEEFEKEISEAAREGTRANMLGPDLLDAESHPEVIIESLSLSGNVPDITTRVRIRIRDKVFEQVIGATVHEGDGLLVIDASFPLEQTALGLEQFSALGGGLTVRDAMEFHLHVEARPMKPEGQIN